MNPASTTNPAIAGTQQDLLLQIELIADQVIEKKKESKEYGLLGGKAGITLMYAYLAKQFPEKNYATTTYELLEELVDALANEELTYNMSAGVAGIAFVFQHLRNIDLLDKADDLNLTELDEFIFTGADIDAQIGNWDPLHGMVGLGIYYLERHKETGEKKYLEKIVDWLAQMRTTVGDHQVWITPGFGKYSNDNYNLGMAHGMPGILSFLALVHAAGIKQAETEAMISSCMPYLLQMELTNDPVYSFPTAKDVVPPEKDQDLTNSRLAWCYGDLCMANALIHCGTALNRKDWKEKGLAIAKKTTLRTFENSGCTDAPYCHGSTGMVHQYHRFFKLTGDELFEKASDNWLDLTLKNFYKKGEGAGGYFFRTFIEEENKFEYVPEYSLLEGSAGIALVYLSYLYPVKPDWDIIFLTNV